MPTTVAQHAVAAFTSPVNGTTPIDANAVRGNDNTMRTGYNNHDSDPGIHVQSSTLASRPVAGTAGRKWITEDSGVYTLWIDDGANWHPVSGEAVALSVYATQTLVKGDVVKVTGWNNGQDLPEVAKVSSATDVAFAVMTAATASGAMGYATNTGILQDVATNAFSVGDILYPNTSGYFTATKPTSGNYQPCGFVLRSNVSNGVLYVEFSAPRIVERSDNTASTVVLRDASGNFSAGTITATLSGSITGNAATATALQTARNINGVSFNGTADITVTAAAGTLTGTTLASNVVSSSLTSVGTLANLTVTNTITGSVSGSSGSTTGNAATATALQTARNINGVSFNGTADITVTAAAGTLSGNTLASGVTASSLTSVGTLTSLTVSGNLTVDTNTLFVDAANNRVGIIQGTPLHPFHVGTTDLILNTSGNLGLGVTPSAWNSGYRALEFASGAAVWAEVGGNSSLWTSANATFDSGGAFRYKVSAAATGYNQQSGAHSWYTAPSGTAGNAISFTQSMTLNANGNLGIATTLPANRLSVIGNVGVGAADFTASAYLHANAPSGANRNIGQFSVAGASNGMQINWDHASTTLRVILNSIPTSSAGLAAGTLWNDSGTIKIA